eukprot:scaffold390464_cov53-Prasinocladus_malaysianus.AAC.1
MDPSEKAETFGIDVSEAIHFESGDSEPMALPKKNPSSEPPPSSESCDVSSGGCVQVNEGSLVMNPDSFDMMPIIYNIDGTDYMSFNEVQFQVAGSLDSIDPSAIASAVADLAGVELRQVQTVSVVAGEHPSHLTDDVDNQTLT